MKSEFKQLLYEEAKKMGIELTQTILDKFEIYKNLLLEYNEKVNLTAITDEHEIIMKHFIDSLEVVKYIKVGEAVIDVGTGAGFPGVVIAIFFEGKVSVTLLDALNKRLIFLNELIDKLKLTNIYTVHGRAEEIAHKTEYREKYDVAVSRAVAELNVLLEYEMPFVNNNGRCLLLKGKNAVNEIENSKSALKSLNSNITNIHEYSYTINETYNRCIIEVKRKGSINSKYPRNYGKIKKQPL